MHVIRTNIEIAPSADPKNNSLHRAQTVWDNVSRSVFIFDDALPYPSNKSSDYPCIVRVHVSRDVAFAPPGRATWQAVVNLTQANVRGSGLATGLQLPSGKLILAQRQGCNTDKLKGGDHSLISEDHGQVMIMLVLLLVLLLVLMLVLVR